MAISLATVGGKITAAFLNLIVGQVNRQGSTVVSPTSIAGTGATLNAAGLITMVATPTLNVIGAFTSEYDDYQIRVSLTSKSLAGDMIFRLRTGGADVATNYVNIRTYGTPGPATVTDIPATTSFMVDIGTAATRSFHLIELSRPNVATPTSMLLRAVGSNATFQSSAGGQHTLSTAYPDFTLTVNGTITMNGTVEIIGINKGS